MLFLISNAMADASSTSKGGIMGSLIPILLLFVMLYFLMIRPQQKRTKQHQSMIASLKKGDKVVTNSGIIGSVSKIVSENEVIIEIADQVFVKFVKSAIASVYSNAMTVNGSKAPDAAKKMEKTPDTKAEVSSAIKKKQNSALNEKAVSTKKK